LILLFFCLLTLGIRPTFPRLAAASSPRLFQETISPPYPRRFLGCVSMQAFGSTEARAGRDWAFADCALTSRSDRGTKRQQGVSPAPPKIIGFASLPEASLPPEQRGPR